MSGSMFHDRLRAELESGRNVNGAWLDEDAEALLDEVVRLRGALALIASPELSGRTEAKAIARKALDG